MERIRTFEELEDLLGRMVADPEYAKDVDLDCLKDLELPGASLRVDDTEHGSSLSAETLRSFVEYQDLVYRAVAIAKYGSYTSRLRAEDKAGFDLYVKFSSGSVLADIDWQSIIQMAVTKMDGWQTFGTLTIVTFLYLAYKAFARHSDNRRLSQQDLLRMQERIAETEKNEKIAEIHYKTLSDITRLADETVKATTDMFETLAEVTGSVSVNGRKMTRQELMITARDNTDDYMRKPEQQEDEDAGYTQKIVSGKFIASRIELKPGKSDSVISKRLLNLVNVDTGEVLRNVFVSDHDLPQPFREMLYKAVNGDPLEMRMSVALKPNGDVASILILECDNVSFETPDLFD